MHFKQFKVMSCVVEVEAHRRSAEISAVFLLLYPASNATITGPVLGPGSRYPLRTTRRLKPTVMTCHWKRDTRQWRWALVKISFTQTANIITGSNTQTVPWTSPPSRLCNSLKGPRLKSQTLVTDGQTARTRVWLVVSFSIYLVRNNTGYISSPKYKLEIFNYSILL